jgi:hypothetical protein
MKAPDKDQLALPVFGPSLTGDGHPRCTDWTRAGQPCQRRASITGTDRHGALCAQHAAKLRKGGQS